MTAIVYGRYLKNYWEVFSFGIFAADFRPRASIQVESQISESYVSQSERVRELVTLSRFL